MPIPKELVILRFTKSIVSQLAPNHGRDQIHAILVEPMAYWLSIGRDYAGRILDRMLRDDTENHEGRRLY